MSALPYATDQALVQACLTGDEHAWRCLHTHYSGRLVAYVRRRLQAIGRADLDAAQEVVSAVWCLLLEHGSRRLRAFEPERGSLGSYLTGLSRAQLAVYCRTSQRWAREHRAALSLFVPDPRKDDSPLGSWIKEFLQSLAPRERDYCESDLLPGGQAMPDVSPVNARKLRQRVRARLLHYLDGAGGPAL